MVKRQEMEQASKNQECKQTGRSQQIKRGEVRLLVVGSWLLAVPLEGAGCMGRPQNAVLGAAGAGWGIWALTSGPTGCW